MINFFLISVFLPNFARMCLGISQHLLKQRASFSIFFFRIKKEKRQLKDHLSLITESLCLSFYIHQCLPLLTFTDVNECGMNNGGCEQDCVNLVGKRNICLCRRGFRKPNVASTKCLGKWFATWRIIYRQKFEYTVRVKTVCLLRWPKTAIHFQRVLPPWKREHPNEKMKSHQIHPMTKF